MSDSSVMFAAKEFTTSVKTVCRFRPFSEFESKRHKGALKCAFDVVDNVVYRKRDHSENPFSSCERTSEPACSDESQA